MHEHERNLLRFCSLFTNQQKILASIENSFHSIYDFIGNKLVIYSKNNVLFIPTCYKVQEIEILQTNSCFVDTPVQVSVNNKTINAFLTNNNFIKSFSNNINCKKVNKRIILPSTKLALVRVGNNIKEFKLNNVIVQDIKLDHFNFSSLNYFHHKEIVQGYDFVKEFHDISEVNDIDGNFYNLPNDEINSSSVTETSESHHNYEFKFLNFKNQFNSFIVFFVNVTFILAVFNIFVFLKLIRLCNTKCLMNNQPSNGILPLAELAQLLQGRAS
ncbi:unnamed protein product [Brachionus calyciflorus]|uniref:Uncharacterized protein n=1 Tax=Brachionus calyciflorus TaxID=104777 RepID=A0A814R2A8_9BILA|nr:unnamed protein product [Brachionus calyciflorus]